MEHMVQMTLPTLTKGKVEGEVLGSGLCACVTSNQKSYMEHSKNFKHGWERIDVVEFVSDVGSFISTPKHQENKDYRGWSLLLYVYSFVLVNPWEDKFMRNRIVLYIYIYNKKQNVKLKFVLTGSHDYIPFM